MIRPIHIVPAGTNINFMRGHKITFVISLLMVLGSFVLFFTKGLNFGIDFAGGIVIEASSAEKVDLADMRTNLERLGLGEVALQQFGDDNSVLIRVSRQEGAETATQAAVEKIKSTLGSGWNYRRTETVGPKVGQELIGSAGIAIILAMGGILLYVWIRYEWQFAVNAILALFHDCVTTLGLFSLLGLEFNLTIVAAILTIAGYSVNDTVVIYDRIRYDLRRYKTMSLGDLINQSLNTTLSRTTVTSGLTLLSVIALYFVGGKAMSGFALAMIWGIVIGTYSTICVATPLLLYMKLRRSPRSQERSLEEPSKA